MVNLWGLTMMRPGSFCPLTFLVFPTFAIKGGTLVEKDYLGFSGSLLRLIRFFYIASLGSGVAMIVLLIGCKYMGWVG